jgi:hypothetical protein
LNIETDMAHLLFQKRANLPIFAPTMNGLRMLEGLVGRMPKPPCWRSWMPAVRKTTSCSLYDKSLMHKGNRLGVSCALRLAGRKIRG